MRIDGTDSISGNGYSTGSGTATSAVSSGHGSFIAGRAGDSNASTTETKSWFKPVDVEISDCPGGVCPVPWAKKEIDNVNHPSHYTEGGIECIEAIEAQLTPEEYKGYLKGNVAKYIWREKHKGGIESLEKAQWYLNKLVQLK
jgi:hypothetical protein